MPEKGRQRDELVRSSHFVLRSHLIRLSPQAFPCRLDGDTGEKYRLVTSRSSSRHLNVSGASGMAQQVYDGRVRLVPFRWACHTDLDPLAVEADNGRTLRVWNYQHVDLNSMIGFSDRLTLHQRKVTHCTGSSPTTIRARFDWDTLPVRGGTKRPALV
jgi:hypothetical protein